MKLAKSQLEILHILWSSDTPLSIQEIAERSKYRFAGRIIVDFVVEELLAKKAVYRAGSFHDYSGKREIVLILYAAEIHFDEYYAEKFKNITPRNLFNLIERLLHQAG